MKAYELIELARRHGYVRTYTPGQAGSVGGRDDVVPGFYVKGKYAGVSVSWSDCAMGLIASRLGDENGAYVSVWIDGTPEPDNWVPVDKARQLIESI